MPVASLQPVTDPADERLADYVSLTDVALRSPQEPAQGAVHRRELRRSWAARSPPATGRGP